MEEIRDLRVQKTYDALITAFCDLMNEKSFEEITVKKLCAHAKTKTATFYSHFSDKYDFFAFMAKELRSSFIADIESDPGRNAATYYTSLVSKGMDYLEQNKKLAISVKGSGILSGILQFMPDEIMVRVSKVILKLHFSKGYISKLVTFSVKPQILLEIRAQNFVLLKEKIKV